MARITWRSRRIVALAAAGGVGLLTMLLAVGAVVLIITDPVGTADAVNSRDPGPMISALASLIWRAVRVVLEYL